MTTTPYQFVRNGNLFIVPVGPQIDEVPYRAQPLANAPDYSLWVRGKIEEAALHLNHLPMTPQLYQDVRDDLQRFSPVEVTRSVFRRGDHAYVGVIDSRGTPYYFALDSRGISVREVPEDDDRVWKTFARLAEDEYMVAVKQRRQVAAAEMTMVDRELSQPTGDPVLKSQPYLVVVDDEASARAGRAYAAAMRAAGADLAEQLGEEDLDPPRDEDDVDKSRRRRGQFGDQKRVERTGADAWRFRKALPRKSKEKPTKKTPVRTASSKKVGAGGKPRYSYPREKAKPKAGPRGALQQPLVVVPEHDDSKHADPTELANQLGVSVRTLRHAAKRLGREGFTKFMRSHLKRFAAKHRLDPDYWGTLYARLHGSPEPSIGPA